MLNKNIDNFYGNIESRDIFKGLVDIIICDGFVGNILLKSIESNLDEFRNMESNRGLVERYWGYSSGRGGKTIEYEVEHPWWPIYGTSESYIDFDFGALYGEEYGFLTDCEPTSTFYCPGSDIKVRLGRQIT